MTLSWLSHWPLGRQASFSRRERRTDPAHKLIRPPPPRGPFGIFCLSMLSRRSTLSLTALLAAPRPGLAWAKAPQFWEAKPAADWSENEIKELMTKSPWAKQVTAEFKGGGGPSMGGMGGGGGGGGRRGGGGGGGGMGGGGGAGGGGDMGGGGMSGGGGGGGGAGGGMPSMPQIKATIRWETAAPIIQAGQRKWPASVAGHYLISVSGLPMPGSAGGGRGGGGGRGPQQPQQFQASPTAQQPPPQMDPQQRARMMGERLKESSHLDRKGKDPIAPAHVEIAQARDGSSVIMLLFPKGSQPIEAADKEVTFITAMGMLGVKAKFALKDMMVKGQLEL